MYLDSLGQRKEKHIGRSNAKKLHNGIDFNGYNINPPLRGFSCGYKQHLCGKEASKRRHLRSSRGVHGGS